MKLSKRIIAILLLAVLLFALSACSGSSVSILGVSTPTTPLAVSDGSTVSDSETPVAYRNDYFKYSCVLPNDWYVLNEDELSQVLGRTSDALGENETGDVIQQALESGESLMDFYSFSGDSTRTINIVLGKVRLLDMLLPEQTLIDASVPLLTSGLADMGATNITHSTERVEFLGKERVALNVQGDFQGVAIYETIFIMRKGLYVSSFTVSSLEQDTAQDSLAYFQIID